MTRSILAALGISVAALLAFAIGAVAWNRLTYFSEYNALLREIQKHPNLRIVDHWQHQDLTLEDFGFAVRGAGGATVYVNISDGSNIRTPRDRAIGIALKLREYKRERNSARPLRRFIEFDSADWQRRGLPKVRCIADVLGHFDEIATSLLNDPPATVSAEWADAVNYIEFEKFDGRLRWTKPPEPMSKLSF